MVMTLAAREVFAFVTEDNSFSLSNSENGDSIGEAIPAYCEKSRLVIEGFKYFGAVMEEPIPGLGPCSIYTRRISRVSEDE